jgi:hypothetical protein
MCGRDRGRWRMLLLFVCARTATALLEAEAEE